MWKNTGNQLIKHRTPIQIKFFDICDVPVKLFVALSCHIVYNICTQKTNTVFITDVQLFFCVSKI